MKEQIMIEYWQSLIRYANYKEAILLFFKVNGLSHHVLESR